MRVTHEQTYEYQEILEGNLCNAILMSLCDSD